MHRNRITTFVQSHRLSAWPFLSTIAIGLAIQTSAVAQKPPGLPSPVAPPPGAPAPQPHQPAGADKPQPEGLLVEPANPRVTGRIVRIEDDRITLEDNETNEKLTFAVDGDGEIVLNKKPAELRDLRPGDFVRLTLTPGAEPEAELVWAARPKEHPTQPDQTFPPTVDRPDEPVARRREQQQGGGLGVIVANWGKRGALVVQVRPQTPAAAAGANTDDVIVGLDNQPIETASELVERIRQYQPGETVMVTVDRQGQRMGASVTLTTAATAGDLVVDNTGRVQSQDRVGNAWVGNGWVGNGFGFHPGFPFFGGTAFGNTGFDTGFGPGATRAEILDAINQELAGFREDTFLPGGGQSSTFFDGTGTPPTTFAPPIPPGGSFEPGAQPGTGPVSPGTIPPGGSFEPGAQPSNTPLAPGQTPSGGSFGLDGQPTASPQGTSTGTRTAN